MPLIDGEMKVVLAQSLKQKMMFVLPPLACCILDTAAVFSGVFIDIMRQEKADELFLLVRRPCQTPSVG